MYLPLVQLTGHVATRWDEKAAPVAAVRGGRRGAPSWKHRQREQRDTECQPFHPTQPQPNLAPRKKDQSLLLGNQQVETLLQLTVDFS